LAQVIYTAWKKGAKFDGWDEMFQYHRWVEAFQEQGVDMNTYLQEIPEKSALPWEHIDKGIRPNFLRRERKNAYEESIIIDCKEGTCHACGIQRKNGFREFAVCYKQLDLHTHNGGKNVAEKQLKSVRHIGLKQRRVELADKTLLRIHFEKMGFSKYLSHLDMMRVFERGFRRAAIKMVYSQGFNPRPKMSFGPALPLGYTSSAEFVDVEILSTVSPDFKEILNSVLPEGINILQIKTIPLSTPSLNASINMAEYQIKIRDHETAHNSVTDFLKRNDINITRITKGRRININIRPYVESIARDNGSLFIQTKRIEGRTVRITEILSQIYDSSELNIREIPVHRTQQYIKSKNNQKSPMDDH
jgi:radical SAM-linked protein